jgi:hypothetical protein
MTSILKKIIRNDAMKEDPTEIYNARSFLLTLTVSISPVESACSGQMVDSPAPFRHACLACSSGWTPGSLAV